MLYRVPQKVCRWPAWPQGQIQRDAHVCLPLIGYLEQR